MPAAKIRSPVGFVGSNSFAMTGKRSGVAPGAVLSLFDRATHDEWMAACAGTCDGELGCFAMRRQCLPATELLVRCVASCYAPSVVKDRLGPELMD